MTTVKDVKARIEDLRRDRENFLKIQEYCLGHMSPPDDEEHTKVYGALEDGAQLNEGLRNLASKAVGNIDIEIARLKRAVDSARVDI